MTFCNLLLERKEIKAIEAHFRLVKYYY